MNTDMKIINQIACLKVDTLGTLFFVLKRGNKCT
jgi:hypothetical protein